MRTEDQNPRPSGRGVVNKKTPAQLLRRIALLEAQNAELQDRLARTLGGWGELCMEKIVFEQRCINALKLLSGEE